MSKTNGVLVSLGRNVRRLREAGGLTQDKLAEKADLDRTFRSRAIGTPENIPLAQPF